MKDIKTKGSKKDIRVLDKSANLSAKMKNGLARTKDQMKNLSDDGQVSPSEYAEDNIRCSAENMAHDTAYFAKGAAKKTYNGTKNLIRDIRGKRQSAENIKQTAKSTGKATTKTVQKSIKTAGQAVKTPERTARTAIKTSRQAAKTTEQTIKVTKKAAEAAAKAAKKSAQAAKATAKAAAQTAQAAVKATITAVKAAIAGTKALIAAIAAGGSVAVIIIIVICLIALIVGSCFGVFFSGDDTGTGMTMSTAISGINTEYTAKIDGIKASASYDKLEMRGGKAAWSDVLAVYAVKTANDPNNPTEVASMDDSKYAVLKNIFWDMHTLSSSTASKTEKVTTETRDDSGNIIETESTVTRTYLYITVAHKSSDEIAAQYGFTDEQKVRLAELLSEENKKLWSGVFYGYTAGSEDLVSVALSQIGNTGGEPYWRWYGFNGRVEWCATFVSWVANECGYIDTGVIPKFASCRVGVQWFKDRGQWRDSGYIPKPGDIIFFDWIANGITGTADHVGIVERVDGNTIYTVEGNSGDACKQRQYPIGSGEVLGYGVVEY